MRVVGKYSLKQGEAYIEQHYPALLQEVYEVLGSIQAGQAKTKQSAEKTKKGKMLYSPKRLNQEFDKKFLGLDWKKSRVKCDYSQDYYLSGYSIGEKVKGAYREMDYVKETLGVEIQFGKYAFMVYNVCAKMTIFSKMGIIQAGIEIVPVKTFAKEMSSGVSYYEQFVWDLEQRGVADIDIPVLILGIDLD